MSVFQQVAYGSELDVVGKRVLHEVFFELDVYAFHVELFIRAIFRSTLHTVGEFRTEQDNVAFLKVNDAVSHQALSVSAFHIHQLIFAVEVPRISETRVAIEAGAYRVGIGDGYLFV